MAINSIQKVDAETLKSQARSIAQEIMRNGDRWEYLAGYLNKFQTAQDAIDFGLTAAEAQLLAGFRTSLNNIVAAINAENATLDNLRPPLVV